MFHSIRARLIALCVAITAAALLVLAGATFAMVRGNTRTALDAQISQLTRTHAQEISEWLKDKQQMVGALTSVAQEAEPLPFLQLTRKAGGFDAVFISHADKRHASTSPPSGDYDPTTRDWYRQALQAGGPIITAPYTDAGSGRLTVTLATPLGGSGQAAGVAGSDLYLDSVTQKVAAIRPMSKSFAMLLDGQGRILAHARAELALKPVTALAPGLEPAALARLAQEGGHAQVQVDGAPQMLYAAAVAGTPWLLAIGIDEAEATAPVRRLLQLAVVIAAVCVALAVALMSAVVSRQLRGLALVRDAMRDIASGEGDLTRRLDTRGNDELAQIAQGFNQFADKIAAVLLRIRDSAESVRVATSEIASGNHDLSGRTESQASSLQETAAAMEQLTATVQQNAANARQANALAHEASQITGQGAAAVQQVVQTMDGIHSASRKIEDIIGVIDGIAFQTNILALNAAVEAARAGEQGRGFAVVAAEVRQLAQRSATAAKEIKALIDDSVNQVDAGSRLVQDAGQTMQQVEQGIRRVSAIVAEISNASQEQSTGIAEVGDAVSQMDQATQQNAALVEEASAAAQSLQQQAHDLAEVVAGFRLPQGGEAQRLLR
ncbi:methyl-accepting chemotaxis protein [Pulveribacter suum]|uniref:Chemotaxis protein n=1 Tax=Pulveribacter suum TaxID=2116657 RepID=A0A2P1NHF1_9BURK|nr:methyl-accepting chemotaxis protein [Pulveribacter suum]AVP56469.1 chemotaxis protein [Pulveribacter suum]